MDSKSSASSEPCPLCVKIGKRRGWIDDTHGDADSPGYLDRDMQGLLALYAQMTLEERSKFFAIGKIAVG